MKKKRITFILALALLFTSFPFFAQEVEASPKIKYTVRYKVTIKHKKAKKKLKLSSSRITTTKGEIVFIKLNNAKYKKVKWYSSNKKIATVKKDGKWCSIKAKKPGKVTIFAKYKGKKYKCVVKVNNKKENAFYCWSHSNGETLHFRYATGASGEPSWAMYNDQSGGGWYSEGYIGFDSDIYPLSLYYDIGDESIIECRWDEYDDDLGFRLIFYPKKAGMTYLKITNSYNAQSMYFPIVCDERERFSD